MQQRKTNVNGRPSGTDGSDFSYRMVVDSRYTKVARGKSRLSALILIQAVVQFVGALTVLYSVSKEQKTLDTLDVSSVSICFISFIIGKLGQKRSRVNFLKFYMFASSIGILLSLACVIKSNLLLEVIQDLSSWDARKFEFFKIGGVLVGLLVQLFSVITTVSLIGNMSPPKRAS